MKCDRTLCGYLFVHGFLKLDLTRSVDLYMEVDEIGEYLNGILPRALVSRARQPCEVGYFFHLTDKEMYDFIHVAQLVSGRSIKGVLMKDYIKDVVKLLHRRGLFEWSDGHRSQVWRLKGEEVVLCQCQVLSQHVCPREGGNRDVFFAQGVTLEPPVYLCLLLFLPPLFSLL